MHIKETGFLGFIVPHTYLLCCYHDTALSFSWLAQPEWTSQDLASCFESRNRKASDLPLDTLL